MRVVRLERELGGLKAELEGTFVLPARRQGPTPAVLMLHGFASHRDEVGSLYVKLAERLVEYGIASLRIDFAGWGRSDGDTRQTTIGGMVEDTDIAYQYLTTREAVDRTRVGLLGYSLGGGVACVAAGQNPQRYRSLVLWSSVGQFREDQLLSLGEATFEQAARDGEVEIRPGWRGPFRLGKAYFESLGQFDVLGQLRRHQGAFLAVAGGEEHHVQYLPAFEAAAAGSPRETDIIEGADHLYGALLDSDPGWAETLLSVTTRFFARTLS